MKKFRSSYNRVIYLTCFALLIITSAIEGGQYIRQRDAKISELKNKIDQYAYTLNVRAVSAERYVEGLRENAEQYLYEVKKYGMKSPMWQYLKPSPKQNLFFLSTSTFERSRVGNLAGVGNLDDLNQDEKDEIQMALLLNPGFRVAFESTNGSVWLSYTSLLGFQNLYPWLPPSNPEYYTNVLNTPWMFMAAPIQNPKRLNFWTSPYDDGQTKGARYRRGRVVSNISPVYNGDKFIGAIMMDVSVNEFKRLLSKFFIPTGGLILMDQKGNVISAKEANGADELVEDILASEVGESIRSNLRNHKREVTEVGGRLIYMHKLPSVPWVLVYFADPRLLFENDFIHGLEDILIIGLCLIFVVGVGYFVVTRDFISPAQKLLSHIEKENRGEPSQPSDLPKLWAEWFDIVTKIFAENRSLMDDLESRVKLRTQQLQKKNRKLEKTLEDLKKAQNQIILQEQLASLGSLTAGIAHEIKNPLHFIINFTEVSKESLEDLRKQLSEDEAGEVKQIEKNLERVLEHANRADSIVKGMLSHARGGDGKLEEVDINKLLTDAVDLAYAGFCGKEKSFPLEIKASLDMNLPAIRVSPPDISRVFLNIANNACFAMHEKLKQDNGTYNPILKLRTLLDSKDNNIHIIIEDNGTGMSKAVMKNIFHPFFTTKETGKGTGLGMSMSYDILTQQHKGEMWIESEIGEFSRFHMKLPC